MSSRARVGARGRPRRPADQQTIRDHNMALVLQRVAAEGQSSRADLAVATGLNKTTVSSLVGELIERRLLRDDGLSRSGSVGRPATSVRLNGDHYVALGMEVNVDYLAYSVVDLSGRVRDERFRIRDNRDHTPEATLRLLADVVAEGWNGLSDGGLRPVGAALALPGLVDPGRGELLVAPNLGWGDVAVRSAMEQLLPGLGIDLAVENEANLAALAERWLGAGRDLTDFIHVSGEVGIGAGVVIGGELHCGAAGFGGEFGHMTLVPDGPACRCGGNGCVETYVGLEAVLRHAGIDAGESLRSAQASGGDPVGDLVRAAREGDGRVLTAVEEAGTALGTALASAVNLLSPQAVVLGGYLAPLHDWLAPVVATELRRRVLSERRGPTAVLASQLARGAAVRGAATLILRGVLADPASVPAPARHDSAGAAR